MIFGNEIIKEEQNVTFEDMYDIVLDIQKYQQSIFELCVSHDFMSLNENYSILQESVMDKVKKLFQLIIKKITEFIKKIPRLLQKKIAQTSKAGIKFKSQREEYLALINIKSIKEALFNGIKLSPTVKVLPFPLSNYLSLPYQVKRDKYDEKKINIIKDIESCANSKLSELNDKIEKFIEEMNHTKLTDDFYELTEICTSYKKTIELNGCLLIDYQCLMNEMIFRIDDTEKEYEQITKTVEKYKKGLERVYHILEKGSTDEETKLKVVNGLAKMTSVYMKVSNDIITQYTLLTTTSKANILNQLWKFVKENMTPDEIEKELRETIKKVNRNYNM